MTSTQQELSNNVMFTFVYKEKAGVYCTHKCSYIISMSRCNALIFATRKISKKYINNQTIMLIVTEWLHNQGNKLAKPNSIQKK